MTARALGFRTLFAALLLLIFLSVPAQAQDGPLVKFEPVPSLAAYPQGGTHPLALRLTIAKGFHINSPSPGEGLIPTKVTVIPPAGLSVTALKFPPPQRKKLDIFDKPISTYSGALLIKTALKVAPSTAPGTYELKVKVAYQGCNDTMCTMPIEDTHAFKITVSPAGKPGKALNRDVFARN